MDDCIFCKIAAGQIPSHKVYEDEHVFAFCDIEPQAPVHVLVIPKIHVSNVLDCEPELMTRLVEAATAIAHVENLEVNGFRIVINTGKDGNQSVSHLHLHILGGRLMGWPPG